MNIKIGGMNKEKYLTALKRADIKISNWAEDIIGTIEFQKEKEEIEVKIISVKDLGFPNGATTQEIYNSLEKQALEVLPPEAGIAFRLAYKDQPLYEWVYMGMKQITGRGGDPGVFRVGRGGGGLWLDGRIADPVNEWYAFDAFGFRLRKEFLKPLVSSDTVDFMTLSNRISALEKTVEHLQTWHEKVIGE